MRNGLAAQKANKRLAQIALLGRSAHAAEVHGPIVDPPVVQQLSIRRKDRRLWRHRRMREFDQGVRRIEQTRTGIAVFLPMLARGLWRERSIDVDEIKGDLSRGIRPDYSLDLWRVRICNRAVI